MNPRGCRERCGLRVCWEGIHHMHSAATTLAPEPAPSLAQVWALMVQNSREIAEMRRLAQQHLAVNGDDTALVLAEARMSVLSDAIDRMAAAITLASLTPGADPGPVAVPGPSRVPAQRIPGRRPLMTVVRP